MSATETKHIHKYRNEKVMDKYMDINWVLEIDKSEKRNREDGSICYSYNIRYVYSICNCINCKIMYCMFRLKIYDMYSFEFLCSYNRKNQQTKI